MTRALKAFFATESSGGILLGLTAVLALLASNSPWSEVYLRFIHTPGAVHFGTALVLAKPLIVWVNDLWMAVFFFLVGLEIKREFTAGELSNRDQAILPAVAALGGMVMPALIYALINHADPIGLRGWAIPAATDIAFAIGIVTLLGSRVPPSLKIFLTAVAIIDDLGAIVVIALFYTQQLSWMMLAGALVCLLALYLLNRSGVTRVDVYVVIGLILWLCVLKSGVHATLAGVATALFIPSKDGKGGAPAQTLEHGLHPWVAYLILPMFAFANAGLVLTGITPAALLDALPLGIAAGLLVGKTVGVFGSCWLMVRLGWAKPPAGAGWVQLLGVAVLCGIGFTMSLFIGGLAFEDLGAEFETRVKLGVLLGSLLSGLVGAFILVKARKT